MRDIKYHFKYSIHWRKVILKFCKASNKYRKIKLIKLSNNKD